MIGSCLNFLPVQAHMQVEGGDTSYRIFDEEV